MAIATTRYPGPGFRRPLSGAGPELHAELTRNRRDTGSATLSSTRGVSRGRQQDRRGGHIPRQRVPRRLGTG
jgi:hypothetical protein